MLQAGQKYRGRAVAGQFQIARIATTGTRYVDGLIEVTMGPELGQRIRFRGYMKTAQAAEGVAGELRAMGWTGARWGDWSGLGKKEVEFTCLADENDGKTYLRAAFVRELRTVNARHAASAAEVEDLNAMFPVGQAWASLPPPPVVEPSDAADVEIPF